MSSESRTGSTLTPPHARGTPEHRSEEHPPARPRSGKGGGIPDAEEQAALRRSLGKALQELRAEAGMTQTVLGLRSGVSRRSVQDLEAGRRRPSLVMLRALAVGSTRRLPPGPKLDSAPVLALLVAAAGSSVVADTPGGTRRRERRLRDAGHQYVSDVDLWWAGECALAQRAELAFVAAIDILDRPGALDDLAALTAASRYMDIHRLWMSQERRFQPPMWRTSAFRKMAQRHGYPVGRRGRTA